MWSIENPGLLERCTEILVELQQGIEATGLDLDRDGPLLETIYGDPAKAHLGKTLQDEYSEALDTADLTEEERERHRYSTPEVCKQHVLEEIGAEIARLEQYQEERESTESKRMEVEILRQRVPDTPGLDGLLRYMTTLDRAFDRMLNQYDRAQRVRKGQPLLPQVDIKIS